MKTIYLVIAVELNTERVGSIKAFAKLSDAQSCAEYYNSLNNSFTYIVESHHIQ